MSKGSFPLLQWLHRISHFNSVGIALEAFIATVHKKDPYFQGKRIVLTK